MIDPHRQRQSAWQVSTQSWWRRFTKDGVAWRDLSPVFWSALARSIIIPPLILVLFMSVMLLVERLSGASGPHRPHDPATYLPFLAVLTVAVPVALVILIWSIIQRRARQKRGLALDHSDHRPPV